MEEIIKRAESGGWKGIQTPVHTTDETKPMVVHVHWGDIVCDPLFWQALGKSCKWRNSLWIGEIKALEGDKICTDKWECYYWEYYALRFYEINLTEGWSKAVAYLQSIL